MTGEIASIISKSKNFISKNSPTILTFLAVGGLVTTAFIAAKDTPKALKIIEEKKKKYNDISKVPKMELIKDVVPIYIPTAIIGGASILCIIGSNSINLRRNAALASLYSISDVAYKELRSKVEAEVGEKKMVEIRDDILGEKMRSTPIPQRSLAPNGNGHTFCFDAFSGQYFWSDIESIRRVMNDVNYSLINNDYISLNEVYYELGIPRAKYGDEFGWNIDHRLDFVFSSQLTEDGIPCLVLDYEVGPKHDYKKLF